MNTARTLALATFALITCVSPIRAQQPPLPALRPPAIPLVVHDPYVSVWTAGDRLGDRWPTHWTGAVHALVTMLRVDGRTYALVGLADANVPLLKQTGVTVYPTRTVCSWAGGGVRAAMTFMSPLLPEDIRLASRTATYITLDVESADGGTHDVSAWFDVSGEWAVHTPQDRVTWSHTDVGPLDVMRIGTVNQPVLAQTGDAVRIDWGYFLLAAPKDLVTTSAIAGHNSRRAFEKNGGAPHQDDAPSRAPCRTTGRFSPRSST